MERERATGAENEARRRGDRWRGRKRQREARQRGGPQAREQRWGKREEDSGPGGGCVRARHTEKESSAASEAGKHPGRCVNPSMMSVTKKKLEQQVVDRGKRLELEVRDQRERFKGEQREGGVGEGRGRQRD